MSRLLCLLGTAFAAAAAGTSSEENWDIILMETGSRVFDLFSDEVSQFASSVTVSSQTPEIVDSTNTRYVILDELAKKKGDILKIRYEPINNMTFYASATCVTSEGGECGFQTMGIKPNVDNHISWVPYSVLMHPKFSHVEWHLLRRVDDLVPSDAGKKVTISYVTANNRCQTEYGSCNSVCFNGKCGVKNHFHEIECQCLEEDKKEEDEEGLSDEALALVMVLIGFLILVMVVSCVVFFCLFRQRPESAAPADDMQPPPSREVSEAQAEELVVNFSKHYPTEAESCCVCLLTPLDNTPDSDSEWIVTPCGHSMHTSCIRLWLVQRLGKMQDLSCPVCRTALCSGSGNESINVAENDPASQGAGAV